MNLKSAIATPEPAAAGQTDALPPPPTRRSDRISIEIPLEVSGDDINRFAFVERTRTAVISRHGAKIYSQRKLGRDQELIIRCLATGKEAEARVVGELAEGPQGFAYGMEFLNPGVNIWDIEFPALTQAEQAAGRTLLECFKCRSRELVYLDAISVEVLDSGQGMSRLCKLCTDITIWKVARDLPADKSPVLPAPERAPAAGPGRPEDPPVESAAKDAKTATGATALLRHPILGDEVVTAENISPGGLSIRSIKRYREGAQVEVALPYTKGGANIFVAARIERLAGEIDKRFHRYELVYLSPRDAWQRR